MPPKAHGLDLEWEVIPLSLLNCNRLGFDVDLVHQNHYVAHETTVRREADFFKIPQDAIIEVGFRVAIGRR